LHLLPLFKHQLVEPPKGVSILHLFIVYLLNY
jgi:hypothetical protein